MSLPTACRAVLVAALPVLLSASCIRENDPGPLQSDETVFALVDFDRIDAGDAFLVTLVQGPTYSVRASGDRRNLDDLNVTKLGTTLKISFVAGGIREHATRITVTMPRLAAVNLSGATNTTINGFSKADRIEVILSGASLLQLEAQSGKIDVNLMSASKFWLLGAVDTLVVRSSGASEMLGYECVSGTVEADASGASKLNLYALQSLKATLSGASILYYRGNPALEISASGGSEVRPD